MSAMRARKPGHEHAVSKRDRASAPVRLADEADASVSSGAHALQAQLRTGLLAQPSPDERGSPARGVLIAIAPAALAWFGVICGLRALMHHGS